MAKTTHRGDRSDMNEDDDVTEPEPEPEPEPVADPIGVPGELRVPAGAAPYVLEPRLYTVICSLPKVPVPSMLGSASWGGQVWPYGKMAPSYFLMGGRADAYGDLTVVPGTFSVSMSAERLEQVNKERAACCMPLITPDDA